MPPEPTASLTRQIACQVCGRKLVPLKDGTSRRHYADRRRPGQDAYDRSHCRGSGYRLARWPVGQELYHHSGDRWLVVEDRGGTYGDYWLRCLVGREQCREMVAHGEYMHRHGWMPCPPDLMKALEESLGAVRNG